jgi:Icc protein
MRAERMLPLLVLLAACLRPSEGHVALDEVVGDGAAEGSTLTIDGGLGAIRRLGANEALVWAAAPVIELELDPADLPFTLEVRNVLPDAELTLDGAPVAGEVGPVPTWIRWAIDGPGRLRIAPPDAASPGPYRVAVLSDIQEAIDQVQDIFGRMNEDDSIRFVVSTGDLSDNGTFEQLVRFQEEMESLEVPLYSTAGNHEVPGPDAWHELFGPFSSYFEFRGVAFALVDSSNASIDPSEMDQLRPWLDAHVGEPHLFLTHVPLLDASGLRGGAFRSRNEAARTVNLLAEGEVDALFFGHVHSYYAYSLGGIESYISGGGGAIEEELDGISRHYLTVDLDPATGIQNVGLVRVD